jgi:hypothetical protein
MRKYEHCCDFMQDQLQQHIVWSPAIVPHVTFLLGKCGVINKHYQNGVRPITNARKIRLRIPALFRGERCVSVYGKQQV